MFRSVNGTAAPMGQTTPCKQASRQTSSALYVLPAGIACINLWKSPAKTCLILKNKKKRASCQEGESRESYGASLRQELLTERRNAFNFYANNK